jgi:MYXO-CTERM domain-containing protein
MLHMDNSTLRTRLLALLAVLALLALAAPLTAEAQAPLLTGLGGARDFGTDCLSPNDDGSSSAIDLTPAFPTGLAFYGRTHTRAFVNTNGNITFSAALSTYTPDPFPVAGQPMIAPYWADVDIRGAACSGFGGDLGCSDPVDNGVWWHLEPGLMVVTWNQVGYYYCADDKKMNFQLILSAATDGCGGGDFDVEFRFNRCEWHTGDASGGLDGFCDPDPIFSTCTPGQSGFDAGNLIDFVEIMGSRTETIHTTLCTDSNVGETGVWRFQIRSGSVICPEAGDSCDTEMTGVCGDGLTQCVGAGIECLPVVPSSDEACDALDNDCDGTTDEGDDLCGELSACERGVCTPLCFEGGCPEGQECNSAGRCLDIGCDGIECAEGERCMGGTCVAACDGVVCPAPLSCRAGACLDICSELTCDDCTVCDDGACIPRCPDTPCAAGEECDSAGRCVDAGCASLPCPVGETCVAGACQDVCIGAVCPPSQECTDGMCRPIARPMPDGGVADTGTVTPDAGPDSGGTVSDATICPIGFDCSDPGGREDGGCGCETPGATPAGGPWSLAGLAVLVVGLLASRRRMRVRS